MKPRQHKDICKWDFIIVPEAYDTVLQLRGEVWWLLFAGVHENISSALYLWEVWKKDHMWNPVCIRQRQKRETCQIYHILFAVYSPHGYMCTLDLWGSSVWEYEYFLYWKVFLLKLLLNKSTCKIYMYLLQYYKHLCFVWFSHISSPSILIKIYIVNCHISPGSYLLPRNTTNITCFCCKNVSAGQPVLKFSEPNQTSHLSC